MRLHSGISLGVTFVQVLPSSCVSWISPSSVPTQSRPFVRSATPPARRSCRSTPCPESSSVMSPPDTFCLLLSLRVRSGLIACQCTPPSVVLKSTSPAVVERVRIVRRNHDRRRPLEAVLQIRRAVRVGKFRLLGDRLDLPDVPVVARDVSLIVRGVNDIRIGG